MTLLDHRSSEQKSQDAEALFKEARQRRRRRRLLVAGVVVVVLAALGSYLLSRPSPRRPIPTIALRPVDSPGPVVNTTAFAGHGQLAFVSRGTLWVLDGSTKSLHQIRTPGLVPVDPSFSPDGKWLAFVASKEISNDFSGDVVSTVLSSTLWFARANGTDAHPVTQIAPNVKPPNNTTFGWNPHKDLFAASVGTATFGRPPAMGVDLVSPTGSIRQLAGNTRVVSAVWSPDGSAIAVSTEAGPEPTGPPIDGTLTSYPVHGGAPTTWLSQAGFIVTAGWWPVWGIGYTTVGSGAVPGGSATADGSPIYAIARPGSSPIQLGMTLQNESTGVPSATPTGWLAFVQDDQNGAGRTVWEGKQVVVCSAVTALCRAIPHPAGTVTDDPVWTPTGLTLA
jgi:WD40-like Beta Propeller Repeat